MMLGLLLAPRRRRRAGAEKHADFLRDFRGDTNPSSTLEVMHELGCSKGCCGAARRKIPRFSARIADRDVTIADLSRLPVRSRFIAMMPQWTSSISSPASKALPDIWLAHERRGHLGLVEREQRIVGVRLKDEERFGSRHRRRCRHSTCAPRRACPPRSSACL